MEKIRVYFRESYDELVNKVSWPPWSELQGSAIVVMVASLIIAILIFGMDIVFQSVMKFFYNLFV